MVKNQQKLIEFIMYLPLHFIFRHSYLLYVYTNKNWSISLSYSLKKPYYKISLQTRYCYILLTSSIFISLYYRNTSVLLFNKENWKNGKRNSSSPYDYYYVINFWCWLWPEILYYKFITQNNIIHRISTTTKITCWTVLNMNKKLSW